MIANTTTHNSILTWLRPLLCRAILLTVMLCMEVGLTMQDQHKTHTS